MIITRIVASALTATIMLGAAAAPAIAREQPVVVTATNPEDVVSRDVRYGDLNLASVTGERALVKRVRHVVSDVCSEAVGGSRGYLLDQSESCKDASWQGASPQIDRAVQRARDIAANGWSAIAPVAIRISVQ
jgi:UrcA family protein